ncbi:MFS transporter [Sansalvadorimonas verongulae]|nr:MFS transporter [Sansalvadorimonas verongulae]
MRWQVLLGIYIGYAGYYLIRKNFTMAMPDLIALGYTKTGLGLALSGMSLAYSLSRVCMGVVSDRSDSRKFIVVGLCMCALLTIAMGVIPYVTSCATAMFVSLFVCGCFQAFGYPGCVRAITHWYTVCERGVKMSFWKTSSNAGAALVGPLAILAINLFEDWHSKIFLHGFVALAFAFVAWIFVRDTPQSCGLPNIEEWSGVSSKSYSVDHEREMSTKEILFKHVLNQRVLWYLSFANIFVYLVRYGVLDWTPTYLEEVKGLSLTQVGWAYSAYEIAGIPGILLTGWLSDRFFKGRRGPAIIIFMLLVSIAVFVYWHNPAGYPWVDAACLFTVGFLIYGPVVLIGIQSVDAVPKKAAGTATGLTSLFGYLSGALLANIAMGIVVDMYGWNGGFSMIFAACLLSAALVSFTLKQEKEDKECS